MRRVLTACVIALALVALAGGARPTAQGGPAAQPYYLLSTTGTNATVMGGCQPTAITGGEFVNLGSTPVYLRIYNRCTTPDETHTPVLVFVIPGSESATSGAGHVSFVPAFPVRLSTGFAFRLSTGVAVTSTAGVNANQVVVNFTYY